MVAIIDAVYITIMFLLHSDRSLVFKIVFVVIELFVIGDWVTDTLEIYISVG